MYRRARERLNEILGRKGGREEARKEGKRIVLVFRLFLIAFGMMCDF